MSNLAKLPSANATVSGGITIQSVDDLTRLATLLAKSGYFSDAKEASQAATKILCGLELGIPAISALSGIFLVKGKPIIGAGLMAAAVKRSGKYNYRVSQHTAQVCEIIFFEHGQEVGRSVFTAEDARKAGTQNMDRHGKNMLFARAISNGVKWHCPDVFLGPVYTPEELGQSVDFEGEPVSEGVLEATVISPVTSQLQAPRNPNQATIKSVADILGIADRDTLATLGTAAIDNTFPGRKTAELTPAELDEYLAKFCQLWSLTQGCFRHDNHAINAWSKFVNDEEMKGLDMIGLARAWQIEVERRQGEKIEGGSMAIGPSLAEAEWD